MSRVNSTSFMPAGRRYRSPASSFCDPKTSDSRGSRSSYRYIASAALVGDRRAVSSFGRSKQDVDLARVFLLADMDEDDRRVEPDAAANVAPDTTEIVILARLVRIVVREFKKSVVMRAFGRRHFRVAVELHTFRVRRDQRLEDAALDLQHAGAEREHLDCAHRILRDLLPEPAAAIFADIVVGQIDLFGADAADHRLVGSQQSHDVIGLPAHIVVDKEEIGAVAREKFRDELVAHARQVRTADDKFEFEAYPQFHAQHDGLDYRDRVLPHRVPRDWRRDHDTTRLGAL